MVCLILNQYQEEKSWREVRQELGAKGDFALILTPLCMLDNVWK